jgi:hypothetical protein
MRLFIIHSKSLSIPNVLWKDHVSKGMLVGKTTQGTLLGLEEMVPKQARHMHMTHKAQAAGRPAL